MKSLINRIAIALLVASLASVSAFAKTKKETVTFETNIKVNGTLINKGVYDLRFDDKTNEVEIVKNNKVIARAPATIEKRGKKSQIFLVHSSVIGDTAELTGVTFAGADHNVMLRSSQASN
jgi:hypothetical protein